MGLTKGIRLTSPKAFVAERFGAHAWESLATSLSVSDQALLHGVVPSGWYDHAHRARLVRRLAARFGSAAAVDLGRYEADRDLTTVHRWFLRLVKPSFAIRNMNLYWCRSEAGGRWASEVHGDAIVARLSDWDPVEPALCRTLEGYLGRTLERLGGGSVTIQHVRCRGGGDPFCEFRTQDFRVDDVRTRWSDPAITQGDLPGIAYELTQFMNLEAVANAIVEVSLQRLSFSCAALRVRTEPGGEPRLLGSAGRLGSGIPHCFVRTGGTTSTVPPAVGPQHHANERCSI